MKFGCQGSTWVLNYDIEKDMVDKIVNDVQEGGFKGIDIQVALLGKYKNDPKALLEKLNTSNVELAALTLPLAFLEGKLSDDENNLVDYYLNFLSHFPNAKLNVPSRIGPNRDDLYNRQKEIITGLNIVGEKALDKGIIASVHPISYKTSYWITREDYDVLLNGINSKFIGYTPDVGHIIFGDMNPVEIIKEYLPLIKHVHFKDATVNKEWMKMGEGDIDFKACVSTLRAGGYDDWIMFEEETPEAQLNTSKVIVEIGKYAENHLLQLT